MIRNRLMILAGALALAGGAQAVDWGLTTSYNFTDYEGDNVDADADGGSFQIGVTLNTGGPDQLFSYRGTLSYLNGDLDIDGVSGDLDVDGFAVDNSFGFRVAGNSTTRLWLGPSIDVQVLDVEDEDAVGVGIGGTIGLDLRPAGGGMYGIETGFRVGKLVVDVDDFDDEPEFDTTSFFVRGTVFLTGFR